MRHTFAAACLAQRLGKETAEEILKNHEDEENPDQQDLANNASGVSIGIRSKGKLL